MPVRPLPGQPVRGSTTGRPLMAVLDLVGRRWALRILWELQSGPLGARELARHCDGMSSSVLYQRLDELTSAGIVEQDEDGRYELTDVGSEARQGAASTRSVGEGVGRGTAVVSTRHRPLTVLVVTWDGGGNRQPFEVVVGALAARGDTVRVISNEVHRDLFESLGAAFVPLDVADKHPATRSDLETQIGRVREVMFSPLTSRAVLQHREGADVGLVDVVMLSAQAACERARLPFVSMHHTLSGVSWSGSRRAMLEDCSPTSTTCASPSSSLPLRRTAMCTWFRPGTSSPRRQDSTPCPHGLSA